MQREVSAERGEMGRCNWWWVHVVGGRNVENDMLDSEAGGMKDEDWRISLQQSYTCS